MSAAVVQLFPGAAMPALRLPAVEQSTLDRYAQASGDHARIHLDHEAARAAGLPNVIAHGLLVMAWLGRAVCGWLPEAEVRDFSARFQAVTNLGDSLVCSGSVADVTQTGAERLVRFDLLVEDQRGEVKIRGSATLAQRG